MPEQPVSARRRVLLERDFVDIPCPLETASEHTVIPLAWKATTMQALPPELVGVSASARNPVACDGKGRTVISRDSLPERRWQSRARAGHEAGDAGEAALTMQPRAQDDENLVGIYLQEIGRYALLTRNDEVRLYEVIAEGRRAERDLAGSDPDITVVQRRALHWAVLRGKDAQQSFVQCNLRLVASIARRYRQSGRALPDLIQDGNLGPILAVTKFDARKGFKFSAYATSWICQSIVRGIESTGRTIRLPAHAGDILRTVTRAQEHLGEELGRPPTIAEPGVAVGTRADKLADVLRSPVAPLSLDEPLGERGDATASDLVELGVHPDLSRERVRQIEARAMCMLCHPSVGAPTHDLLVER
ncbi:MAG: sigma factor [Acidimicrobiales bacterium]